MIKNLDKKQYKKLSLLVHPDKLNLKIRTEKNREPTLEEIN